MMLALDNYTPELIQTMHSVLLERKELWRSTWSLEAIIELNIGWDGSDYIYPVYDEHLNLLNVIKGKYSCKGCSASLYPLQLIGQFDEEFLVFCEGMSDLVTLRSIDVQAVTSTAGADSIPKYLAPLARFNPIFIVYDNDQAGKVGANKLATVLKNILTGIKIRIADLSHFVGEKGDVCEYLTVPGKNRESLISEVLECAPIWNFHIDLPDQVKRRINDPEFFEKDPRDRDIYVHLAINSQRYWSHLKTVNGQTIVLQQGDWLASSSNLAKIGGHYKSGEKRGQLKYTPAMIDTSLNRLRDAGFITWKDLGSKSGRLIRIEGYDQNSGANEGAKFPRLREHKSHKLPTEDLNSTYIIGGATSAEKLTKSTNKDSRDSGKEISLENGSSGDKARYSTDLDISKDGNAFAAAILNSGGLLTHGIRIN